jgi:hypothetical protein
VGYASRFNSGQTGVLVVKKGTTPEMAALKLENFGYGHWFYVYSFTKDTDNGNLSLKVFVQGEGTMYAASGISQCGIDFSVVGFHTKQGSNSIVCPFSSF